MIPSEFIDELLTRTDIVEVIAVRMKLKKTGQNYTGLCPFHDEKTPSFSVSQDKQFYYCFGCHATGSALKFVMKFDRLEFPAAIELLASHIGLEVPQSNQPGAKEKNAARKSIYHTLQQAAEFYQHALQHHATRKAAVDYLRSRQLSGQVARDFGLGFAPAGWDNLYTALTKTNHERALLIEAGLIVEKDHSEQVYDRFRARIMFPIRDLRGRVIAFGGRAIGDIKPKYLNSPETKVFHKRRELYGLYEAKHRSKKLDQLLVVEGYMDVVALAQHGINHAVATLGTATSGEHLARLFRVVPRVIFCFDGDQAGHHAAWRALQVALPHLQDGCSARFLFVPNGEDPDSLVREEGPAVFLRRVDCATPLERFFFEKLSLGLDMDSLDGKAHLSKLAMPLIAKIPLGVFRELMLGKLSEITHLTSDKLLALNRVKTRLESGSSTNQPTRSSLAQSRYKTSDAEGEYHAKYTLDGLAVDDSPQVGPKRFASIIPLTEQALRLLLRQPELCAELPETVYDRLVDDRDAILLLEVIQAILKTDIHSPVLLLASFQNNPAFGLLKSLAEQEPLLPTTELSGQFVATIHKLITLFEKRTRDELKRTLATKPYHRLSEAEKAQLKSLVQQG